MIPWPLAMSMDCCTRDARWIERISTGAVISVPCIISSLEQA